MIPKTRDVVITGMGIVSSLGQGVPAFREALSQGRSNFIRSFDFPILSFPVIGAYISDFNFAKALATFTQLNKESIQTLSQLARLSPRSVQIALISALEAWQNAEIESAYEPSRIGLVVGAQNSTTNYQYDLYQSFAQQPQLLSPYYALHFMDTNYVGVLSQAFGILGEGFTVGGASATGNVALLKAYQLIRDGWQDACLVVGVMADLSPLELQGFYNLGALGGAHYGNEPQKACRPFDKAHEGFIPGQAVASLLLESAYSAKNRNAPILGYILSGALILDANCLSNPQISSEYRAMRQALEFAKVDIEEIDYINAHGTSAPLGDDVEIKAIDELLAEHANRVMVNSTKSLSGHCLWSAGMVEAIATLIQIQGNFVHPNLNLDNPISTKIQLVGKECQPFQINMALSNSFGFSGINTTLVLRGCK